LEKTQNILHIIEGMLQKPPSAGKIAIWWWHKKLKWAIVYEKETIFVAKHANLNIANSQMTQPLLRKNTKPRGKEQRKKRTFKSEGGKPGLHVCGWRN